MPKRLTLFKTCGAYLHGLFAGSTKATPYFFGNALPPFMALLIAPLILGKVGLETYAVLGLATYFYTLIGAYSDFNTSTHLLSTFSKGLPSRFSDFGNALALRVFLLCAMALVLAAAAVWIPRNDALYLMVAVSVPGALLPMAVLEWLLIARRQYWRLFFIRAAGAATFAIAILAWYHSPIRSAIFVPVAGLTSALVASLVLTSSFDAKTMRRGFVALRQATLAGAFSLARRVAPMAIVLLLAPYFVAYALPWYMLVEDDPVAVGVFSIGYRIVIGLSALIVPLTLYLISRAGEGVSRPSVIRSGLLSLVALAACWVAGLAVIRYQIDASGMDAALFPPALRDFSILMIALYFLAFRTPFVASCVHRGKYARYLAIHAASCLPVVALSWIGRDAIPPQAVPWLACIPDALAALLFALDSRQGARQEP